jgi:hypothetical protein
MKYNRPNFKKLYPGTLDDILAINPKANPDDYLLDWPEEDTLMVQIYSYGRKV